MRLALVACLALLSAPAGAQAPAAPKPAPADLVVHHAAIWTVDAAHPRAQAIAIARGVIVAIGTNEEVLPRVGPATRVIDAHGRAVLPGFTDAHVHFLAGSLALTRADLEGARDVAELRARLVKYRDAHPGTSWIQGRGWNYAMFGAEALPHKKYLDDL
ncbi:MAG: amidohydrolase family protein, partial [Gemmatimonadetes bacterium]|nr:amidohydrolase family protein [Gemmatimonadota bacterium]